MADRVRVHCSWYRQHWYITQDNCNRYSVASHLLLWKQSEKKGHSSRLYSTLVYLRPYHLNFMMNFGRCYSWMIIFCMTMRLHVLSSEKTIEDHLRTHSRWEGSVLVDCRLMSDHMTAIIIWRRPTGMTKGVTIKPSLIPRPSVFDAFLWVMSKFAIKDLGSAFNLLLIFLCSPNPNPSPTP